MKLRSLGNFDASYDLVRENLGQNPEYQALVWQHQAVFWQYSCRQCDINPPEKSIRQFSRRSLVGYRFCNPGHNRFATAKIQLKQQLTEFKLCQKSFVLQVKRTGKGQEIIPSEVEEIKSIFAAHHTHTRFQRRLNGNMRISILLLLRAPATGLSFIVAAGLPSGL
jgi:hypothetical protein